jgi:hypothetical protein
VSASDICCCSAALSSVIERNCRVSACSTVRQRAAVWIWKLYFCSVRLQDLPSVGLCWLVLSYIGWYWVILAGTELYWLLPNYVGWYWGILALTELCWLVLSYIGSYRVVLAGTELYWLLPSCIGWYWVTLAGAVSTMQQAYWYICVCYLLHQQVTFAAFSHNKQLSKYIYCDSRRLF